MSFRRNKKYLVFIKDEEGGTRPYLYMATSHRRAEKDAKDWAGEALVGVERAEVGSARRLLAVAAVTCRRWRSRHRRDDDCRVARRRRPLSVALASGSEIPLAAAHEGVLAAPVTYY